MADYKERNKRPYRNANVSRGTRPNQHQSKQTDGVQVKIGDKLLITVKRLGINGEGIGYYKRKITFIPGALPDEVVEVEVTNFTPKFIEAEIIKIKKKSPDRVVPVDDQSVGGVELAHLAYPAQLAFKQDIIRQALEKYQPRGYEKN